MNDKDKNSREDSEDIPPIPGDDPDDFDIDPDWENRNKKSNDKKKKFFKPVLKSYVYLKNILEIIFDNLFGGLIALFFILLITAFLIGGGYTVGYSLLDLAYSENQIILLIAFILFYFYFRFFLRQIQEYKRSEERKKLTDLGSFIFLFLPILVFMISLSVGFNYALNDDSYETNKQKIERENSELLAQREEEEEAVLKALKMFEETLVFEENWNDLYTICVENIEYKSYYNATEVYLVEIGIDRKDYYDFLRKKNIDIFDDNHIYNFDEKIRSYCEKNFSNNPVEEDFWKYSALWLNEVLDINNWITGIKKMCENYPIECENNKKGLKNFDFEQYTLAPAFEISNKDDKYLCYLHRNDFYSPEDFFTADDYVGKSGTERYDAFGIDRNEEEVEDYFHPIGNQYLESSVIFPKPKLPPNESLYDEAGYQIIDSEFYFLNPLENWGQRNSIISEPIHLWNCMFASNINNQSPKNGEWLIPGFGPPIVRGKLNPFSSNIANNISWKMWSIAQPGPNSIINEYEITEIYWFNRVRPIVEYCRDFKLSSSYLQAKRELDEKEYGPLDFDVDFIELINEDFVNADFCENYLRYYFEN